ncbi:FAD-binding protein [bacterium]|nr:FAD-binding protein [bacterium]
MLYNADVIVVGAGTAGCFFAWRMAERGYDVLVLEQNQLENLGKHIEIFHMGQDQFDPYGIPHPEPPELIHTETINTTYSPDLTVKLPIRGTFYVMHMPVFMQRMQGYARAAGVVLMEEARVTDVLFEDGALVGVRGDQAGEPFEARAMLVVDASGLAGAVRTRLPEDFGVENAPVPAEKCLYVCLELRNQIPEGFPTGSNGYMFHKAFWNKGYGDDVVLGIGQPVSFDYAWEKLREWREEYFGDPGVVIGRRQGAIPFTRAPFSLVGDGLMLIGDAANQNKPFSGEGVTSGFAAVAIAVDVADRAMKQGDVSRANLWDYNVRYQRGQGAKFAASMAQLPTVAELQRDDVNFLFHKGIIFTSEDFEELNATYEMSMGFGKLVRIALTLLGGVISGRFSMESLRKFLKASSQAGRMKAHYLTFPESPAGFEEWRYEAARLWGELS